jgi:hypothetical protein
LGDDQFVDDCASVEHSLVQLLDELGLLRLSLLKAADALNERFGVAVVESDSLGGFHCCFDGCLVGFKVRWIYVNFDLLHRKSVFGCSGFNFLSKGHRCSFLKPVVALGVWIARAKQVREPMDNMISVQWQNQNIVLTHPLLAETRRSTWCKQSIKGTTIALICTHQWGMLVWLLPLLRSFVLAPSRSGKR